MSASFRGLIPDLQGSAQDLLDAAGAAGLQPRVTSTYRTHSEQARLYRRFQQGLQALPVAPPYTSAHEYGYAFDMVVTPMSALDDVGYTWQQWGGVWGGTFRDPVHFEYPGFDAAAAQQETVYSSSWQEDVAGMFSPNWFGFGQLIASFYPDLDPAIVDAVLHPWKGMDDYVPQFLLDLRKKFLGV